MITAIFLGVQNFKIFMVMRPKDADRIANSVDSDQTAPSLFVKACLSGNCLGLSIQKLPRPFCPETVQACLSGNCPGLSVRKLPRPVIPETAQACLSGNCPGLSVRKLHRPVCLETALACLSGNCPGLSVQKLGINTVL